MMNPDLRTIDWQYGWLEATKGNDAFGCSQDCSGH